MAKPAGVSCPTASRLMSTSRITLPSGVICGVTSSRRLALRNDTAVAPLDVDDWYGSSVPCSISAFDWLAVSTRGLETTLPRWSASRADSSRLMKRVRLEPNRLIANDAGEEPEIAAAGRFTKLVFSTAVAMPRPGAAFGMSLPSCDDSCGGAGQVAGDQAVADADGAAGAVGRHVVGNRLAGDRVDAALGVVDQAAPVVEAELGAEVAREAVVGFDDAGLDQHLAHRDVDLLDQAAHLVEPRRRVLHEQLVGAGVDQRAAALGQHPLLVVLEQFADRFGLLVVQREGFGAQLLDVGDLLARLEVELLLGRELLARRDQDDVAVLAHVEAARLQDDVERLVPRHVLQPQRQVAADRVAGDDVQVGEVGDDLQQRPDVDVLEVQRQPLAAVALAGALAAACSDLP